MDSTPCLWLVMVVVITQSKVNKSVSDRWESIRSPLFPAHNIKLLPRQDGSESFQNLNMVRLTDQTPVNPCEASLRLQSGFIEPRDSATPEGQEA